MKLRKALAALFGLVILVTISPALSFKVSAQDLKPDVDALVSKLTKNGGMVGLSVGVISKSDQPQIFTYGETVKGSHQKPSSSTLFQIGSITKTFTGILLALLAERKIVQFNDPLQKYVPAGIKVPSYNGRQILLEDLATHMSALPRNPPMTKQQTRLTVDEMYGLLRNLRLTREPGRQYEYSNWGFGLLANALIRAAKTADYQSLVHREVLTKLAMDQTAVHPSTEVAQGYRGDGRPAAWNMSTWPALDGAGALHSTAGDMLRYLSFNLGLSQTSLNSVLDTVLKPRVRGEGSWPIHSTGLGWEIVSRSKSTQTVIEKTGGTLGFQTYIGFVREEPAGVVVLANSVATRSAALGREILTILVRRRTSNVSSSQDRIR